MQRWYPKNIYFWRNPTSICSQAVKTCVCSHNLNLLDSRRFFWNVPALQFSVAFRHWQILSGCAGIKLHMKISGQFESEKAAQNLDRIKTYIETCCRNSINEIHALQRFCEGNPYTVEEIFTHESA